MQIKPPLPLPVFMQFLCENKLQRRVDNAASLFVKLDNDYVHCRFLCYAKLNSYWLYVNQADINCISCVAD